MPIGRAANIPTSVTNVAAAQWKDRVRTVAASVARNSCGHRWILKIRTWPIGSARAENLKGVKAHSQKHALGLDPRVDTGFPPGNTTE